MIIDVNETMPIADIQPSVVNVLRCVDPAQIFHEMQMKRHPLASYNVSIAIVIKRFNNVLNALDELEFDRSSQLPIKPGSDEQLLEATDHLLDSLMEHMEDCEKIIGTFFIDPVQKINKKMIELYKKKVEPYRKHIGNIVNFIKHHQGRLRLITFYNSTNFFNGYYIEGLVQPGVIGPVPGIHPGGNSAFSYVYDLRFHIANIFGVSRCLADFITNLNVTIGSNPMPEFNSINSMSSAWIDIIKRVSSYTMIIFPDEVRKPFPNIIMTDKCISIRFPDNSICKQTFQSDMRVINTINGDGVTRSYKVPYFGNGLT